ncbi:uncharacterized protein BP5553_02486 [Venustampulla echinocandica]|uniref:Uncharacterized protein n=1 Tax=Venustampulla echinocandica TaxID=2656787 RepID=A0A370U405_9HELO|nr:uncharacterized protein BP5553_02486 [Venustampulla echinocandica]RDL42507.1 hypothetical protein BP5553_02486 [Venustampulla echinocandica]
MKLSLSLFSLSLALYSVHGIPASSPHDVGLLARAAAAAKQKPMTFEQVKLEAAKMFKTTSPSGTMTTLKWDDKAQCSKCRGKQIEDEKDKTKCRDCKKGTTPDRDHTKCLRDDNGCAEDETPQADKSCKKCPANQVADDTGKKCKDVKPAKEKGKCPAGKILDPAQGRQDASTTNPKCIGDDDSKCPAGQSSTTRKKNSAVANEADFKPQCAADSDPDHKCADKSTFDYREVSGSQIKHSCRSTRKAQDDKKTKYQQRTKSAAATEKRDKTRRTRAGWCFVALSMVDLYSGDGYGPLSSLTQDEVDGLISTWPDEALGTPQGDGSIPDYMVKWDVTLHATGTTTAGAAFGVGAIAGAIGRVFGATTKSSEAAVIRGLKTGARKPASAKAVAAAKASRTVQQAIKNPGFRDCLGTAAGVAAGAAAAQVVLKGPSGTFNIDWSRKPDPALQPPPVGTEDTQLAVFMGKDTDAKAGAWYRTYPDAYIRTDRLPYKSCVSLAGDATYNNAVTTVSVSGGCCTFYNGDHCEKDTGLFSMTNRQDGELRGNANDAISSFWCTFNEWCEGSPK